MARSKLRKRILLVLLIIVVLYSAGYVVSRLNKTIVHSTSAVDGKCTSHDVIAADQKIVNTNEMTAAFYTLTSVCRINRLEDRQTAGFCLLARD